MPATSKEAGILSMVCLIGQVGQIGQVGRE